MEKQQNYWIFSVHLTPNQLSSKHPSQLTAVVSKLRACLSQTPVISRDSESRLIAYHLSRVGKGTLHFLLLYNFISLFANVFRDGDVNF